MSNETVVITGASGGVGRALARTYGDRGATVALLARGDAGLEGAVRDVESRGGRALAVPTDVADAEQVAAAGERVEADLGPIDTWINNAMATVLARTWDISPDEFRRVTEVNYLGFVHGTLTALAHMRPRDRGTIVQVGSALAFRGIPLQAPYCASKHAIVGFTESLHVELLADGSGIRLCAVHLPGLNTTQFTWGRNKLPHRPQPVPPIYQPEVAAEAILWAADHGRRTTYVAGSTALTIWGNRLAPTLVARYLARTNISAQQTDTPASPQPLDNLFTPADQDADRGSHGPFDDQAHASSIAQTVSRNRGPIALGVASLVAASWAVANREHEESSHVDA
jgi:NAD(P)-dependent dehydrogenase (short-subunit alcohol dehydrogenase family)